MLICFFVFLILTSSTIPLPLSLPQSYLLSLFHLCMSSCSLSIFLSPLYLPLGFLFLFPLPPFLPLLNMHSYPHLLIPSLNHTISLPNKLACLHTLGKYLSITYTNAFCFYNSLSFSLNFTCYYFKPCILSIII